jgi:DNA-binding transcriptional regulator YiaG
MAKTDAERVLELREMITSGRARALRVSAGLSQAVTARTLDVDVVTLLRWEKGRSSPRGRNAREYHKLLTRLAKAEAGSA